jgi:hypothetical protein
MDELATEKDIAIVNYDDDTFDVIPFRYSITSYGADYPIDSLVQRLKRGDIFIPQFQRDYVWNVRQASRFIETLLLGLPVPEIFLAREEDSGCLLVIDGQQRMRTIQYYYDGIFGPTKRAFELTKVQPQYVGKSYTTLAIEDRRRLDDTILHATVVRQEEPSDDKSSIYHIFEKINTGGTQLQPQEIRACIYHGPFIDLISSLNDNQAWREIYGPISPRMRDRELISRFLSLLFDRDKYRRPMKDFLNVFIGRNRYLTRYPAEMCTSSFVISIEKIWEAIGTTAFRPRKALNAAVFDAVMVGLTKRLEISGISTEELRQKYAHLLQDKVFTEASERATADEESVRTRIERAITIFWPA